MGTFRHKPRKKDIKPWFTPGGFYSNLAISMEKQPHVIIAGATGSGKSVVINGFIQSMIVQRDPEEIGFILIDPKKVELSCYKKLPHTIRYADEADDIYNVLSETVAAMELRYTTMQERGQRKTTEKNIFIVIDEYADLIVTQKKRIQPLILRLAQLGRAANFHLILATQRPTRDIIDGAIKVNIDSRIALRCPTAQDSRNILNCSGAELLPRFGQGYYITPEHYSPELLNILYFKDEDIQKTIEFWTSQNTWYHGHY